METIRTKQQLLERIEQERAQWEAFVSEVGEQRMHEPGAMGAWTFKDVVAHLTTWWQREVMRLEATRNGESPVPHPSQPDVQVINQWIYQTNRYRPLEEVLYTARATWDQFEGAVEALAEQDLTEPGRFAWLEGNALGPTIFQDFVGHFHEEHEPDLRAWLADVKQRIS